jgi:hypothetical protein
MRYTGKILMSLMIALAAAPFSSASVVTWNLSNVTFSDAATASGSFDFNSDTNTVSNWNIAVTSGVLSAFTYTPDTSSAGSYFQVAGYQDELLFMMNGTTRQLRLTPLYALTNAGGSVTDQPEYVREWLRKCGVLQLWPVPKGCWWCPRFGSS